MIRILLCTCVFVTAYYSSNAQLSTLGPAGASAGVNDWVLTLESDTVSDLLYVGGEFTTAGNVFSPFIAAWDGNDWHALGSGLNAAARAMVIFEGNLYVGGEFTEAGGTTVNGIAMWDGNNWNAVGDGFDEAVLSLCIFNNELYAGGRFGNSGSNPANSIARWNGLNWEEVGGGLEATGVFDNYVRAVVSMTVMQNQLYVGGYFNEGNNGQAIFDGNLVRWNGFSWQDIPSSFGYSSNVVWAMKEREGILWAAGIGSPYIRTFDGVNWLTGALSPLPQYTVNGDVYTLDFYDGYDIVGGGFQGVGINQIGNDVLFDDEFVHGIKDEEWYSFGGGVNNSVICSEVFQDQLYVGGAFTRINNGFIQCNHIVRWRSPLNVESTIEHASCNGVDDGTISLTPTNGLPPYTYNWSDIGLATGVRSGLESGTYTCTITDSIGRTETSTVLINAPTVLSLDFDVVNTTGNNGSITLSVTGGEMPYEYDWDTGETVPTIENLSEGLYNVDVEDANGCIASGSATVDTLLNNSVTNQMPNSWNLYPNPAINTVHLRTESSSDECVVAVFTLAGKKVVEKNLVMPKSEPAALDISTLSKGCYVITIRNEQKAVVYRETLVKQ